MSIRFDLTDLRLFMHVAEAANITRGANRANMALASASERIRAMEDALGVPLLERQRRGVRLTSAGSTLVHHARIVTQQINLHPATAIERYRQLGIQLKASFRFLQRFEAAIQKRL